MPDKPAARKRKAPPARSAADAGLGRQALKTKLTREKIITAVIGLIKEGGFSNASSSRIAERAGMTWGAAQHHFGSKEDILAAIMDISHERFSERMADPRLHGGALSTRAEFFVEQMWAHYQDDLYLVTVEILLATRGFQQSVPSQQEEKHIRAHQKTMREIFHDSQLNDQQMREAMTFVHCFLTGLTIERVFERKVKNIERHLQRIKLALVVMLSGV